METVNFVHMKKPKSNVQVKPFSAPPSFRRKMQARANQLGLTTFSAYLQYLMRKFLGIA